MADDKKEDRKICSYCFDLIRKFDTYEIIDLPDGTSILMHSQCIEDALNDPDAKGDQ